MDVARPTRRSVTTTVYVRYVSSLHIRLILPFLVWTHTFSDTHHRPRCFPYTPSTLPIWVVDLPLAFYFAHAFGPVSRPRYARTTRLFVVAGAILHVHLRTVALRSFPSGLLTFGLHLPFYVSARAALPLPLHLRFHSHARGFTWVKILVCTLLPRITVCVSAPALFLGSLEQLVFLSPVSALDLTWTTTHCVTRPHSHTTAQSFPALFLRSLDHCFYTRLCGSLLIF